MNFKAISLATISSLLVACGGGGGGSSSNVGSDEQAQIYTGVFVDSPVRGLYFETPSQSGLTNINGQFEYAEGETISFYLGGTLLGSAQGADVLTPFDLVGSDVIDRASEIAALLTSDAVNTYDRAINIATLLQSLDLDANPDNGINLASAHTTLEDLSINLNKKASDFANDPELLSLISVLGRGEVKELESVATHLYSSLNVDIRSDLVNEINESLNERETISVTLEHDENDNIISSSKDLDNDGIDDVVVEYAYDESGNLISKTDSATQMVETMSYDDNNNVVVHFTDNLRQPDIEQNFAFNASNQIETFEVDNNADGVVDKNVSYEYGEEGELLGVEADLDADGMTDSVASLSYENGELEAYEEDSDNDGSANLNIEYEYDAAGKRVAQRVEVEEQINESIFQYDANGNVIRYEQDNDLDGRADYIEASEYDVNNNRTSYRRDLDADGAWDVITEYTYDISGNRTSMKEDSDGDGVVDKEWSNVLGTEAIENGWEVIMEKVDS